MSKPLAHTNVVITGSTGRLGQRILAAFQPTGASLITVDHRIKAEIVDTYEVSLATQADVTDEGSVVDCFNHIQGEVGSPDVVIHTVGGWDGRPFTELSFDRWNAMLALNLTSAFLVFREALRHMQDNPGTLIAFASGQGADRGVGEQAAYSAAKGGLVRLVESISAEYQATGIRAHTIAPSTILYDEEDDDQQGVSAIDLAALCVYLSTEPGRSLNGSTLRAYGP